MLDVYKNDGKLVRSFGEGLLRSATDLALPTDDRVFVLDEGCYVHMFSEHGDHLSKSKCLCVQLRFTIQVNMSSSLMYHLITFTSKDTPNMASLCAAPKPI